MPSRAAFLKESRFSRAQGEKNGVVKTTLQLSGDPQQQFVLGDQIIVEGAVKFDVLEGQPVTVQKSPEGTHLIDYVVDDLLSGYVHEASSEAYPVGKTGVSADGDAAFPTEADGAVHDGRVGGMKPAGDIGGGDEAHHPLIAADGVGAEGFSHIAVEIDECRHGVSNNAKNDASSRMDMPSVLALSNFDPGASPATT